MFYTSTWTHDIYVKHLSLLIKLAVDYSYIKRNESVIPSTVRKLALNKYKWKSNKKKERKKKPQINKHGCFLLVLLFALWSAKGTPISAGSDMAPFLVQVQVIMKGRLFTIHFHHRLSKKKEKEPEPKNVCPEQSPKEHFMTWFLASEIRFACKRWDSRHQHFWSR